LDGISDVSYLTSNGFVKPIPKKGLIYSAANKFARGLFAPSMCFTNTLPLKKKGRNYYEKQK